jgi:hypothetical protein
MDSNALLAKILETFREKNITHVEGYTSFGYIRETGSAVLVTRQHGQDTRVPYSKILKGIDAYKADLELYNEGPDALRACGITHVNSPVWSMLHLISVENYSH